MSQTGLTSKGEPFVPKSPYAFVFATGADTAGCNERLIRAMNKVPVPEPPEGGYALMPWRAHSMVASQNYIRYPIDLQYNLPDLLDNYDKADLIQINSTMHGQQWYDRGQGKPTVIMHHGYHTGHFAKDIYGCVVEASELGATQVGSTVNLELLRPLGPPGPYSVTWTPTPYDLDELARLRARYYKPHPDGIIRVAHAPTDRAIKSTEAVIAAVKSLRNRGFPVELVLIEGRTYAETMFLKATYAEILVDQLNLGYGCNAIEAWGLGIPVIGAVNEFPAWRAHMVARFGLSESRTGLPFMETDENGLEATIASLVGSRTAREEWSGIGLAHVQRHHSQESVASLMASIWNEARLRPTIPSTSTVRLRGLGGRGLVRNRTKV